MTDTLTPANIVLLTLELLIDDIDLDELFVHAGVSPQLMLEPDALISTQEILALTASAKLLTNDPALGLHLGEEIGVEMLDVVGMLASTAPNMRSALQSLLQYSPLLSTMGRAELFEEGDNARLLMHLHDDLDEITAYCVELFCAALWNFARRLVKGEVSLRRINVRQAAPPWQHEYSQVFGEEVEIVFGAAENSVIFDRHMLDLPMARHTPGLYQRLHELAARQLASRPQPESTCAVVLNLIGEHIGKRLLDLPTVAEYMGLSPRTLQRRLKDEGRSFQQLYDAKRLDIAKEQLLEYNTDIETIAAMLGYSEPANFFRAFKSWSGLSPNEFRRQRGR